MKKTAFAWVIKVTFLLFVILISACNQPNKNEGKEIKQVEDMPTAVNIKINVAEDLLKLAEVWVKNYRLKNSNVNINLLKSNSLSENESNSLLVTDLLPVNYENYLKIKIAKDIIVPIFNDDNPHIQKLVYEGAKPEELFELLFAGNINLWSQLVETQTGKEPIIIYRHRDNSGATIAFKNYLKATDKIMKGKVLNNDIEIVASVKSNPLGLGFCSYNKAFAANGKFRAQGIYILPIDRNSNGIVDDDEHIFDRKDILLNAYNKGNYPKELTRNTYVFLHSESKDKMLVNFINWLLSEGQNYIEQFGLIPLTKEEINDEKEKLGV